MVKDIRIENFDYPLPDGRIAAHPLADRDKCLLLQAGPEGDCHDYKFADLPGLLPKGTLMVCNNTKVINARLQFIKSTGSRIEVFLLEPAVPADYAVNFQSRGKCAWKCMIGNLKRWKQGALEKELTLADGSTTILKASRGEQLPGNAHFVEFEFDPELTFADVIDLAGKIPIPPYLCRDTEECDSIDYQTVYSSIKGSVAAPTAGLHFTDDVLRRLAEAGIEKGELTLHVGAGTFQPVKAQAIGDHPMHTELFSVSRELVGKLAEALRNGRPVAAVGTTSVRTIESLPYLAAHLGEEMPKVTQWEAYERTVDPLKELDAIATFMDTNGLSRITASTAIMIAPGFKFGITNLLITNFHQPQSTLLLLISAFLGGSDLPMPRWREIYDHALKGDYRFLSYGDACLFTRKKN